MFLQNMMTAATQVAILYIIVLIGFICGKIGIYTADTARKTTDLLFYIVTVAVIVNSFAQMKFSADKVKSFCIALFANLLMFLFYIFVSKPFFRKKDDKDPVFRFATIYGNCAYMGIPLTSAILGAEGVFYASTGIIIFNIICFIQGVRMMTKEEYKFGLKKVLINPGVIGIAIGLPIFLSGLTLPVIVSKPIGFIADMNTPLAMIIFGTYLAETELKTIFKEKKILLVALLKLVVNPIIVLFAYRLCGLTGTILVALTITAAVPSANNTILFAAKYGRDTGVASKTVGAINLLSILTLPVVIAIAQTVGA